MKRFLTLGCSVLAACVVFFPKNANAQARGGMAMAPHAAPMAVPRAMPAARPMAHPAPVAAGARVVPGARAAGKMGAGTVVGVKMVNGVRHIIVRRSTATLPVVTPVTSTVTPVTTTVTPVTTGVVVQPIIANQNISSPSFRTVPGLGFDFPHLLAVFGPDAVNAGRFEQLFGLGSLGSFVPFFNGGFFLPQQPTVPTVVEEEGTDQGEGAQGHHKNEATAEAQRHSVSDAEERSAPEPPKDTPPYVLVKRDGTLVFAVAYSWENGTTLRYMTNQGLWGTVARDALDLDATLQFNEQRGVSFQGPSRG